MAIGMLKAIKIIPIYLKAPMSIVGKLGSNCIAIKGPAIKAAKEKIVPQMMVLNANMSEFYARRFLVSMLVALQNVAILISCQT